MLTTTAADLARNLALAWWPLILTAAFVALPCLIVRARCWIERADAKADAAWADILAAVGLTAEDVRAAYNRREQTW